MSLEKRSKRSLYAWVLLVYIIILLWGTLFSRNTTGDEKIQAELFWGYREPGVNYVYKDNINNIMIFVPIGAFSGLVYRKRKLLHACLIGLFLSETIECAQLIWKLGTFDADDLLNNTFGTFLGVLFIIVANDIKSQRKKDGSVL